ncbi:hypothetical protein [Chitinophaga qingshengii]|uniref:Uncharacterized protein n=1 Tax=Chitinophaga qingshengii TaxID=1569794 RepID=A0ABR7TX42_9BACT|nr:hypothetical protein [Chitinophaga qingshengii]MBC9935047.1 hypothetical protein [Chitinophaga qingshengii]
MLRCCLCALIFAVCFMMMPFAGQAQADTAVFNRYYEKAYRAMNFDKVITQTKTPVIVMVYTVEKGKKIISYFPEQVPDTLIQCAKGAEKVIMETDWKAIFPALNPRKPFCIVQPVAVLEMENDRIDHKRLYSVINNSFSFWRQMKYPIWVCMPMQIIYVPTRLLD